MTYGNPPSDAARAALRPAARRVFWTDRADRPSAEPSLRGVVHADLLVVGGGFTGLWSALLAKRADPGRRVVLLEGRRVGDGASGRNGGFVSASLTHGLANGASRWPEEIRDLQRLGHENLAAIEAMATSLGVDLWRTGGLDVAVAPHHLDILRQAAQTAHALGEPWSLLDGAQTRARLDSPLFLGGLLDPNGVAVVDPAELAWALRAACLDAGVRIAERTPVRRLTAGRSGVVAVADRGRVLAQRVALATNAYPPLLARLSHLIVPVYDYVLVTEPLTDAQWSAIGWSGREGLSDAGNQFHYYRVTPDGRILWGGYDAVYRGGVSPRFDNDDEVYGRLAENFLATFPALAGIRFSHAWGGAIDTCSRFTAFWGTAHAGRTAYVAGYTGLGVGASRFGAQVLLDLLDGADTERTRLDMVRSTPLPFPPGPARRWAIDLTTAAMRSADRNGGQRNLWLRTLDRLGLGFDS